MHGVKSGPAVPGARRPRLLLEDLDERGLIVECCSHLCLLQVGVWRPRPLPEDTNERGLMVGRCSPLRLLQVGVWPDPNQKGYTYASIWVQEVDVVQMQVFQG